MGRLSEFVDQVYGRRDPESHAVRLREHFSGKSSTGRKSRVDQMLRAAGMIHQFCRGLGRSVKIAAALPVYPIYFERDNIVRGEVTEDQWVLLDSLYHPLKDNKC